MLLSIPTNKYVDHINYSKFNNNYRDFSDFVKSYINI